MREVRSELLLHFLFPASRFSFGLGSFFVSFVPLW
jgi:hypothetical protein